MSALPGLDSFTVCYSTKSFSGKSKAKAEKLMMNSTSFVNLFEQFGTSWDLIDKDVKEMEIFTFMEVLTTMSMIQDTKYIGKVTKTE